MALQTFESNHDDAKKFAIISSTHSFNLFDFIGCDVQQRHSQTKFDQYLHFHFYLIIHLHFILLGISVFYDSFRFFVHSLMITRANVVNLINMNAYLFPLNKYPD